MQQMTQDQAIAFAQAGAWKRFTVLERATFQMSQERLCMPFDEFQNAVAEALGRPVFTHEFGLNKDGLARELKSKAEAPSLETALALMLETQASKSAPDDLDELYRSFTLSILKTGFGWNGCVPDGMDWAQAESRLSERRGSPSECANDIAIMLDRHGATWRPRLDGLPNHRRVVNGSVSADQS